MSSTPTLPPVFDEVRSIFRMFGGTYAGCGVVVVAVLWTAVSAPFLGSAWWMTTVSLVVAAAGAGASAYVGAAHARSIAADASGWRIACLLSSFAAATFLFACAAAFVTVETLDGFMDEFRNKSDRHKLRIIFAATFWGGAGIGFVLASLGSQVRRAYPRPRERAAFVVLVLVIWSNLTLAS